MFKIVNFQSLPDGKIRFTVETDDSSTGLMLRLFSQADKFAQLLQYRIQTESRMDASQKSAPEKMAQMKDHRAKMLKMFREIPGTRPQRLKILQEICIADGAEVTQDRLSAQLQLARKEETEGKKFSVKKLIKNGKSLDEIAAALGIPKSTVARLAKSLRGASKREARVKRSVISLANRPPESFPPSPPGENPASIPPGRPKIA